MLRATVAMEHIPQWVRELLPIVALLAVITLVVTRLPKADLAHSAAFRARRVRNWLPVGLTYAFLYMARYNLNACIGPLTNPNSLFEKDAFSHIYFFGTLTYGFSFLINGPLTDRIGGKRTIILAACGALVANALMGLLVLRAQVGGTVVPAQREALLVPFYFLYSLNMYFQSFGAVAIVKVNSAWFHMKERGTFGGIFGILISLGLYFAFDWCSFIQRSFGTHNVFFVPAALLGLFALLDLVLVKDTPGGAGHEDFDLGDASSGPMGEKLPLGEIVRRMVRSPAIMTIAAIEFCSGYLRNAIMQYYKPFTKDVHRATDFVAGHWGLLLCIAGITGGIVAGIISDRVFQSRRGPVSAVLYGAMIAGAGMMFVTMGSPLVGWVVVLMSMAIIGVHGMLSGTASMDFGGKRNVGVVVGVIDGFVYLGTAAEALVLGRVLPKGAPAVDPANWWTWPAAMLPAAVVGFALALRLWNATPQRSAAAGH